MKEAAKRKYLAASILPQRAGLELNQRHTDSQSTIRLVSRLNTMTYKRFCVKNKGYKWYTGEGRVAPGVVYQ